MNINRPHFVRHPLFRAGDITPPNRWQTADDRVMGGVSVAKMSPPDHADAHGVCLHGQVSLENRGGFIQMKWPIARSDLTEIDQYSGVYVRAWGNSESYNIHLRTRSLWLPWQSYRHSFIASEQPQYHYFAFAAFLAYKTKLQLRPHSLKKIAIVAIGRAFTADVCVDEMGFYAQSSN